MIIIPNTTFRKFLSENDYKPTGIFDDDIESWVHSNQVDMIPVHKSNGIDYDVFMEYAEVVIGLHIHDIDYFLGENRIV